MAFGWTGFPVSQNNLGSPAETPGFFCIVAIPGLHFSPVLVARRGEARIGRLEDAIAASRVLLEYVVTMDGQEE